MLKRWLSFFFTSHIPKPKEWPLVLTKVLLFGVAVGILLSIAFTFGSGHILPLGRIGEFILYSSAMGAIFSLSFYITCGIPVMVLRRLLCDLPEGRKRLLMGLAGGINASLGLTLAAWAVTRLFGRANIRLLGEEHFGIIIAVYAILGAAISTVIMMIAQAQREQRRVKEELLRARFSALQSQINPHFLFNTLNSISALIPRRPEAAQDMVGRLAEMFRYALDSQSSLVTLDQELDFVRHYLALEQIRFPDRLRTDLPAGPFAGIRLPGLTLQPIFENAIRYGVAQRMEGGVIEMRVQRDGARCAIEIRNEFDETAPPDLTATRLYRDGHALFNIRERLRIHWNGQSAMRVHQDGHWVTTVIEFPVVS